MKDAVGYDASVRDKTACVPVKHSIFFTLTILFLFSNMEFKIIPQSTQLLLRTTAVTEKENLFNYFYKIVNSSPVVVGGVSECL